RVLRAGGEPGRRCHDPPRPGGRASAQPPRREGGSRAGEDASRRVRAPGGGEEGLGRGKFLPAASGAPGTRVSFGKWTRRAWMGAGYLVARKLDPDGIHSPLVTPFGEAE